MSPPMVTSDELDTRLCRALVEMDRVVKARPGERELLSIKLQLEALFQWTRGGAKLTLQQKGELDFGLLASRYLDDIEPDLARELCEIASYVTHC